MASFGITVIKKLNRKTTLSQFSIVTGFFFEGMRENILHIPGLKSPLNLTSKVVLQKHGQPGNYITKSALY